MSDATAPSAQIRQLLSAEQIQKRVKEMGRQISNDYRGQTIHVLGVLENSFLFMADLVRALEPLVVCTFIKPRYVERPGSPPIQDILFSHPFDIRDQHVLIVEGLVHSGVTAEFLMSNLRSRGAATVKLAALLDRQMARRVPLQPNYFGFLVDPAFLVGYGLGSPAQTHRNLPFVAIVPPVT